MFYDGIEWKDHYGYYRSKYGDLHRYIWEKENGKIEEGYDIHHIDLNPQNNIIDNLACMTHAAHTSIHSKMRVHSEETKEKIRQGNLGKKRSDETKENMKRALHNRDPKWKENLSKAMTGKKFSDEHRKNMSLSRLGKKGKNIKYKDGDFWQRKGGKWVEKVDDKIVGVNKKRLLELKGSNK